MCVLWILACSSTDSTFYSCQATHGLEDAWMSIKVIDWHANTAIASYQCIEWASCSVMTSDILSCVQLILADCAVYETLSYMQP